MGTLSVYEIIFDSQKSEGKLRFVDTLFHFRVARKRISSMCENAISEGLLNAFRKHNFLNFGPIYFKIQALWLFFRDGCPLVVEMSSNT